MIQSGVCRYRIHVDNLHSVVGSPQPEWLPAEFRLPERQRIEPGNSVLPRDCLCIEDETFLPDSQRSRSESETSCETSGNILRVAGLAGHGPGELRRKR